IAAENPDQYTFVSAETITAEFANASSDFIVAPVNAGAKLYKMGKSDYKLAAVLSWGNLFFASRRADFKLDDINGAKITLFGENTINSSIALFALKANGIVPSEVSYLAGAANTQQLLLSDPSAIVLTAEPALTAARVKMPEISSYPLNDLFFKATGNTGFTQAGLFVKSELAEKNPQAVEAYLSLVRESCDKCSSDISSVAEAAVALEILPNVKVAEAAIPNCAVSYVPAREAKEMVEISANIDLKQFGGALPSDDFYYGAK
ncbi:MAG: hypothetical protein K5634_02770, partial [Sphaerochaetaceae bacterium]|nr:hypothetical protein [Sphaerochaetaceae bacterium]